jgi:predicted CXXCH cytochrome family protein
MADTPKPVTTTSVKDVVDTRRRRLIAAERIWYGVLAFVAALLVIGAGIVVVAAHPRSCTSCHATQAASAEGGTHATVRCERCHSEDSPAGILMGRVAVIDMTVATVIPTRDAVVSYVPSARCLGCHADGMAQTVVADRIRMNHRAPVEAGWECVTCHASVGHDVDSALGGYTMDMCLGCHAVSAQNLTTCETCHTQTEATTAVARGETRSPWRVTHGPEWQSAHGMGDLSTCSACHLPGYCVRCHGANVPHVSGYLSDHGRDVMSRAEGPERCYTCHRDSGCFDCHGLEMPHPDGFLQDHSARIEKEGDAYRETCARCHKAESCVGCHTEHTHPGLTPEHIEELRRRPVPYPGG